MEEKLKPNHLFWVSKSGLTTANYQVLSQFYLPIVGVEAFSLYQFLAGKAEAVKESHSEILTWLDFGLPTFVKARQKLEAIGLLQSFVTNQGEYHYVLAAPMREERFLADEIMATLLQGKIGDVAFARLQKQRPAKIATDEKEISATFQSIYRLENLHLNVTVDNKEGNTESDGLSNQKLDWLFLSELLTKQGLSLQRLAPAERLELSQLAELYGYDELALAKVILKSSPEQIDLPAIKKTIAREFNSALQELNEPAPVAPDEDRYAKLRTQGFSSAQIDFVKLTESYPPMRFLSGVKRDKNGYVADSERFLLENLRQRSHLPDSVINVLIDYVLRQQNQPLLQATYVNTIANDWAQKKIKRPEDAMQAIQTLIKQSQNKPARKSYNNNNNRPKTPEQLPEWLDKKYDETEMAADEKQQFLDRIQKLKESR